MRADEVLRDVMDRWRDAVGAHRPDEVAALFTEDAIFQGLRPYGVGREVVADYYASQPLGLAARYEVVETRELAEGVVLGYLDVEFSFVDRPVLPVHLGVVVRDGLISHYQVSRLD
ncbi:hypothetical protein AB0G02_26675 [Actinosynnema sp. NPDC023658]|uniref:hypothetical protein n=1 Tax=Actinosynnema sp. NPDC023658 TaxID=3155465 RepID=UPI0033DCF579